MSIADKCRILTTIIDRTARISGFGKKEEDRETIIGRRRVWVDYEGRVEAQWVSVRDVAPPVGSVVRCMTNSRHAWGVSRFVAMGRPNHAEWILRELGSERELRMHNESIYLLIGVDWSVLSEGWERQMWLWARKACTERWNKSASYFHRFRGCDLVDGVLTVHVGPHIWVEHDHKNPTRRTVAIPVTKTTRLKDIAKALNDAGTFAEWPRKELVA